MLLLATIIYDNGPFTLTPGMYWARGSTNIGHPFLYRLLLFGKALLQESYMRFCLDHVLEKYKHYTRFK
jgi:hypothetical protein